MLYIDERADGDAPDVAHAAEDDHRQHRERDREHELVRARRWSAWTALRTPAKPAVDAPSANASSLVVTVLMPFAAAASSSSRIAFQARPIRILEPVQQDHATTVISATIVM